VASKAALIHGFTPTLKNGLVAVASKERVNSVNPGWVVRHLAEGTLKDKPFLDRALVTMPFHKVAQPKDTAPQVPVLPSPVSSGHVFGINIMVDRAWRAGCCFL
jgi:NAD(P)-dependent dehydrogenase (short-subunit alcohol dehydrogenase family)